MLNGGGMFEATIHNGAKEFRLQEKIAKPGTVNGYVSSLHVLLPRGNNGSLCVLEKKI